MRKQDHIRKLMAMLKQHELNDEEIDVLVDSTNKKQQNNWLELVEYAADYGLENLEIQDQIRMADLAKEVFRDKSI